MWEKWHIKRNTGILEDLISELLKINQINGLVSTFLLHVVKQSCLMCYDGGKGFFFSISFGLCCLIISFSLWEKEHNF